MACGYLNQNSFQGNSKSLYRADDSDTLSFKIVLGRCANLHQCIFQLHTTSSDQIVAKICDFGMARIRQRLSVTEPTTSLKGTVLYIPPERVEGLRNAQLADVYSMGATLIELFTGSYFWHCSDTLKPPDYTQVSARARYGVNRYKNRFVSDVDAFDSYKLFDNQRSSTHLLRRHNAEYRNPSLQFKDRRYLEACGIIRPS